MILLYNLLIPIIMMVAGYYMANYAPKHPNSFIGYRTKLAKKNDDTWAYAHNLCGNLWAKSGVVLAFFSFFIMMPMWASGKLTADNKILSILEGVQVAVMLGTTLYVENDLKKVFDENGNRRTPEVKTEDHDE